MIQVFLVDDQYLMLEGIKAILKSEPGINIVGTAHDGQGAITQIQKLQPDVVLIDIEMPKMNGITATKYICQYLPNTKVIVLTSHKYRNYISQALQAGASSYLLKDSLAVDLKQAIYSISRGYSYIEAQLLTQAINKIQAHKIINSHKKTTYFKKYKKNIYSSSITLPNKKNSALKSSATRSSSWKKFNFGISKASLSPILEPSTLDEIETNKYDQSSRLKRNIAPQQQNLDNGLRLIKKLTWLMIAIASALLSIIIFS